MNLIRRFPLVGLAALLLAGCEPGRPPARPEDVRAPKLARAIPRPGFILTRTDGMPYDFRRETQGTLTFLFFGYTSCPDVCPLHMANLGSVLKALPPEVSRRVRVVFVTTDPERDTPERLREWLAKFDSSFVGLTGSAVALETVQRVLGLPPATRDSVVPGQEGYGVSHAAMLVAFTPDDSAHVVYPWGMKRDDLLADIPTLLRVWPGR